MVVQMHIINNIVKYHSMFKSLTTIPSSHNTVRRNFNYVYKHTIQNIFKLARKNNLILKLLKKLFQLLNVSVVLIMLYELQELYTAD
jgi:hypothetical protein